jgi:hypothetical protein
MNAADNPQAGNGQSALAGIRPIRPIRQPANPQSAIRNPQS